MAWSCEQCGRSVTSNELMCDLCGTGKPGADPEKVRLGVQRDLVMEAHLGALGVWSRIGAVLSGLLAVYVFFGMAAATIYAHDVGYSLGGIFMAVGVGLLIAAAIAYVIGHFLARRSNVARIVAGVLTILSLVLSVIRFAATLFADSASSRYAYEYGYSYGYRSQPSIGVTLFFFVLQAAWTIAVLWALFNRRSSQVCSAKYQAIVDDTPELRAPTFRSPFFFIPLGALAFGFLIVMIVVMQRMSF